MKAGEERKEERALFNSEKGYTTFSVIAEYCESEGEREQAISELRIIVIRFMSRHSKTRL
jgi:hypothetical protein